MLVQLEALDGGSLRVKVVISVHTPDFSFEHEQMNAENADSRNEMIGHSARPQRKQRDDTTQEASHEDQRSP